MKITSALRSAICTIAVIFALSPALRAQTAEIAPAAKSAEVNAVYPGAYALYLDIHEHPELSTEEVQTAAKMASRLRELGYTVTESVGGHGIVALMRNGAGPTIIRRCSRRMRSPRCARQSLPKWLSCATC